MAGVEKLRVIVISRVPPEWACKTTPAIKYELPFLLSRDTA
ncbi:MAG TPA: hypothetical protein VHS05_11250 [Pyrinomonadaceae bacterium]|nr:hypothetical protein [Pyrinomonadaceae bacterium]